MPHPDPFVPDRAPGSPAGGLYVHVPFCVRKCRYCDFYSIEAPHPVAAFLAGLAAEIDAVAEGRGLFCDSAYFGGGTPSLLPPEAAASILERLRRTFRIDPAAEITLEANPGTVDRGRLAGYRAAGVNRLNLGVQSLRREKLEFLGRVHGPAEARRAFEEARSAGFAQVGIDLIYGLPGESLEAWRRDLEAALALAPDHLSCYLLSIEPGTPLGREQAAGRLQAIPEGAAARLFLFTSEHLSARGFFHYEISNFARLAPGGEGAALSRHNRKYWTGAPYLGFGPGAHSHLPPRRFWNPADLEAWLEALRRGKAPACGAETLDRAQEILEAVFLGLRTAWGVDLADLRTRLGHDPAREHAGKLEEYMERGLLRREGERLFPTPRGMLVADRLAVELS
ncbi:MAG: radical SAM family heme chaperone HemW [Desulfobacterales bacterium]